MIVCEILFRMLRRMCCGFIWIFYVLVCRSCFSQNRVIFGALRLKYGNCMPDRSDGVLSYRATLVRISYEFPYFSQSFALVRVLWLKNDNCLLAMRAAGAIVECMISIFPPLTPDFPALWLKSLCRPCERHAGCAHTAVSIHYRLPVNPKYRALVSLSSSKIHIRLHMPGIR